MKNLFQIAGLLMILGLVLSCGDQAKEKKDVQQVEETAVSHEGDDSGVVLNDGRLWEANAETTAGIKNMRRKMNAFMDVETPASYARLKVELEKEFTMIFEKCTMEGAAHDQLHNYLFPMKAMFKGLESPNLKTCKVSFDRISTHLMEYPRYFR